MALTVLPVVLFNNSTGSDSAASGAGPATAVTGTAAAHTNGGASTTITFTNAPNLSGVAQDGSHVLWLKTTSGRQYTRISTVDNGAKTCVVEDSFTIAAGSAVDYAIGGKRSGLSSADSRIIGADAKAGWTIRFEYTGTDYDWSDVTWTLSASGDTTSGPITLEGVGGRPVLRMTITIASVIAMITLSGTRLHINNVEIVRHRVAEGYVTSILLINTVGVELTLTDCIMRQSGSQVKAVPGYGIAANANSTAYRILLVRCRIQDCDTGFRKDSGTERVVIGLYGCTFVNNNDGILTRGINVSVGDCIFDGNARGIKGHGAETHGFAIRNCVFRNQTESGIVLDNAAQTAGAFIRHNVFVGNGQYGINYTGGGVPFHRIDRNAYYNNTSGTNNGFTSLGNDITLSADPFVDAASGDYNFNDTANGGATLRANNFDFLVATATGLYPFRSFVTDAFGGGSTVIVVED